MQVVRDLKRLKNETFFGPFGGSQRISGCPLSGVLTTTSDVHLFEQLLIDLNSIYKEKTFF